jgi:hypothetical protein
MKTVPSLRTVLALVLVAMTTIGSLSGVHAQDEDLEELGLIDETTWESPQFGTEVTWDDGAFTVNEDWLSSDEETLVDVLSLGGDGTTVEIYAVGITSTDYGASDYLADLMAFREDNLGDAGFEEVLADGDDETAWFAYSAAEGDDPFVALGEITFVDGEFMHVAQLSVWLSDLEDGFPAVQDGIEVDGKEPFTLYWTEDTIADLELAAGESADDGDEDTGTDADDKEIPEDDEDAPPSDDTWVAPQYDTEVTWSTDWTLIEDATYSEDGFLDNLRLEGDDTWFQVTVATLQDETLREWMDRQLAFREEQADTESIEVIDEGRVDGGRYVVYMWTNTDDEEWYVYREVVETDDPEIVRSTEFFTLASDPQDVFDLAQETIEIDGDAPFVQEDPLEELG